MRHAGEPAGDAARVAEQPAAPRDHAGRRACRGGVGLKRTGGCGGRAYWVMDVG